MKKLVTLFLVLIIALAGTSLVLAESPAPGGPFNSAFNVQNLETTVATCSYTFYDAAGAAAFTSPTATIDPGDVLAVYVPNLSALADGSYSAVVSCDKKVAAVVNFSDANSGASHSGIDTPAMIWYAPGIYDNYYNYYSNVVAQNAGTGPVDITLSIYAPGQAAPVYENTKTAVAANAAVFWEQEGLTELANNQFYSAVIEATGPIAPVVNIYGKGPYDNQLYSYNAFAEGALTAYVPLVMNNYYGYNTAIVIQNMGTAAAAVTVDYTNGYSTDHTIAPGAAVSLYTPSQTGLPAGNTLYGATVTSDQNIVVLVNESNAYNRAASYSGFAAGSVEVRTPIVEKRYYGYNSSVTCQNIGTAATTMTIDYANSGSTTSPSIAVGATHLFYQPNDPALATAPLNYLDSATITAGQPIVCVVNQDQNEGAPAVTVQDLLYAYNGIQP